MTGRVLVTGASGYLGAHTVVALLDAGHQVRATVRSLARVADVRAMLLEGGAKPDLVADVSFVAADLGGDSGWAEAVDGCAHVVHVASPFPAVQPDDDAELVGPARDGALRVLDAARTAGVERVVLTSSFAAIGYSAKEPGVAYDEDDWTDPDDEVTPYVRSKAVAERAAWASVAEHGGPELVVLNPTGIFGPVLGPTVGTSVGLVLAMLTGQMPEAPRVAFGVVDVRDVAQAHVRAMTVPEAAGSRFLLTCSPAMSMLDVARVLRERLGQTAETVPRREVRGAPAVVPRMSTARAERVLGWSPRPVADTLEDTARSLLRWHGDPAPGSAG